VQAVESTTTPFKWDFSTASTGRVVVSSASAVVWNLRMRLITGIKGAFASAAAGVMPAARCLIKRPA